MVKIESSVRKQLAFKALYFPFEPESTTPPYLIQHKRMMTPNIDKMLWSTKRNREISEG